MKRTFKNSFGITGSPVQLAAFKEYAEGLGWNDRGYGCEYLNKMFFKSDGLFNHCNGFTDDHTTYSLPSQFAEAMAAASEVEIVWEKGDWVVTKWGAVGEIECITNEWVSIKDVSHSHLASTLTPATPEQIAEAMKEREPSFERGEKVKCKCCDMIVMCDGNNEDDAFGGMCIQRDEEKGNGNKGDTKGKWIKSEFTLHTEPVMI